MNASPFWNIIYKIYPPFLRILERLKIHHTVQPYLLGTLNPKYRTQDIEKLLTEKGFEKAILAWKDPGEVLSMRKIHARIFQYHIRLYKNGEIRGHYEYSSEGHPIGHIFNWLFEPRKEYFQNLLTGFLS